MRTSPRTPCVGPRTQLVPRSQARWGMLRKCRRFLRRRAARMANNRARIERRDDARRAYKKVAGILLKTIDERGKDFFPRDKNIANEFRKTFVEGIREFILAVDRVDDIDDQIILFRESILVLIPALMAGYSRARVYI